MNTAHASIHVNRPIEQVFDFMLEPANAPSWRALVLRFEPIEPQPLTAGSRVRLHFQTGGEARTQEITLTECDRPRRQTWVNRSEGFLLTVAFTLAPAGTGTLVTIDADTRGLTWSNVLLLPFVTRGHRARFRDTLARLKAVCEAAAERRGEPAMLPRP